QFRRERETVSILLDAQNEVAKSRPRGRFTRHCLRFWSFSRRWRTTNNVVQDVLGNDKPIETDCASGTSLGYKPNDPFLAGQALLSFLMSRSPAWTTDYES